MAERSPVYKKRDVMGKKYSPISVLQNLSKGIRKSNGRPVHLLTMFFNDRFSPHFVVSEKNTTAKMCY